MVKTGDRVRVVDNENTRILHSGMPECYPEPGSLGTVDKRTPTNNIYWVKWDNLQDDHPWAFPGRWLEVVEEELPNITTTVKITRNKERTRAEVNGECGEVQVQWPYGSVKGPDFVWYALTELLEPVEKEDEDDGTK